MTLALIAGSGSLPDLVVAACEDPPLIVALDGYPPDDLTPDITFRLETLGTLLATLGDRQVTKVCFAGAIGRPHVDPTQIDAATQPLVPRIALALGRGDDGALREVIAIFEETGFTVIGAHDVAQDLLPPAGPLTDTTAHGIDADLVRARDTVAAMTVADIGQACVIVRGQVIAVEASFGTAWMLASLQHRPDGGGGMLYKAPKATQDRRIDLPAIGPETVEQARAAGLDGIAIAQGGVMVLARDETIAAANAAGLWIAVVPASEPSGS